MDMSRLNRMHLPFLSNPDVLHMGLNEVSEESWLEIKSLRNSFKNKIELLENFSHEILFENYEFQSANIKFFEALKTYLSTYYDCLLYTSPSPRDLSTSRMPSSA